MAHVEHTARHPHLGDVRYGAPMDATTPNVRAELVGRMQADLLVARKARDAPTITALRTTIAAIANAEAPPMPEMRATGSAAEPIVGRLVEHAPLVLDAADLDRILHDEIADRRDTIEQYRRHGREPEADRLEAEIAIIERYR